MRGGGGGDELLSECLPRVLTSVSSPASSDSERTLWPLVCISSEIWEYRHRVVEHTFYLNAAPAKVLLPWVVPGEEWLWGK